MKILTKSHIINAIVDIGNGKELLKLYVEELNDVGGDGTIKRAYQLQNITKAPAASVRVQNNIPSSLTNTASASTYTISQLFNFVKSFDKNFHQKEQARLLMRTEHRKLFYHGTSHGGFDFFDIYSGNFGLFGRRAYFTENPQVAEEYTSKGNGYNKQVYAVLFMTTF